MATRRKKPKRTNEREIAELPVAPDRFHSAVCRPMIDPYCDHYRALLKLNEAVIVAVREISGREPPWLTRGSLRKVSSYIVGIVVGDFTSHRPSYAI